MLDRLFLDEGAGAVLFSKASFLKLRWKGYESAVEIPGEIRIYAKRKWKITHLPEFGDTVKEDLGFGGIEITVSGKLLTVQRSSFFKDEIVLGIKQAKALLLALKEGEGQVFEIEDSDGFLARLHINRVVLLSFELVQEKPGSYRYTLNMLADLKDAQELVDESAPA